MRRLCSFLMVVALAIFLAPQTFCYSPEMEELAKMLNEQMAGEDTSVTYDGKNIIFEMPPSALSAEELEVLDSIDDTQFLAPTMLESITNELGPENTVMFGEIFSQFNTNLVMRFKTGKTPIDITLTPEMLLGK